ncbi:hypothetical protein BH24BAC1_BH24BAC1_31320 [soil metagenome]
MKSLRYFRIVILSFFLCFSTHLSFGQAGALEVGVRLQKTLNMYNENGLTAQYQLSRRIGVGLTYVTSRLGSAIGSNAIKQDNVFANASFFLRPDRSVRPYLRGNVGWFSANYESDIFRELPDSSPLLSVEGGLAAHIKGAFGTSASVGYNLITGDGLDVPGTLFPLFYQLSLTYRLNRPLTK